MTKAEKAVDLYGKNFNCSQAVLTAFAEDFGLSEKMALSLGTSFGGGARNGQMCGAVSGALMVLGLKFGHFESENQEQKTKPRQSKNPIKSPHFLNLPFSSNSSANP